MTATCQTAVRHADSAFLHISHIPWDGARRGAYSWLSTKNNEPGPKPTHQRGRESKGMKAMTTKNTAKSIVAAALAAALAAGTAVAPALAAEAAPAPEAPIAVVAQSVSSDYAIDVAVDASPLYWSEVSSIDWYYDCGTDDYVVTLYSVYGGWYTVWVDATTGAAWQIA